MRWWWSAAVLACLVAGTAHAQTARDSESPEAFTPAGVMKLLEAYAVVQAQEMLGLDDAQYSRFVPRFRALVDARRRAQVAHGRAVQELNRLTRPDVAAIDETRVQERLKQLGDDEERSAVEIRKALAGVDEVLSLRQRARFRVFEEQMERRTLELLTRARQNARPGQRRFPR